MAVQFHPLPLEEFPENTRPYIARLNRELRDLFALEGTLKDTQEISKRSDDTIARRQEKQVHVSRITPSIADAIAGTSTVIGIPNLTFGLTNVAGTTNSMLSVNSALALFTTDTPPDCDAGSPTSGLSETAANLGHKHTITTAVPNFTLGTSATIGTAVSLVRADATIPIFDTTAPGVAAGTSSHGGSNFAADAAHQHLFPTSLQSATTKDVQIVLSDDGGGDVEVNFNKGSLTNPVIELRTDGAGFRLYDHIAHGADPSANYVIYSKKAFTHTSGSRMTMFFDCQAFNSSTSSGNAFGISGRCRASSTAGKGDGMILYGVQGEARVEANGDTRSRTIMAALKTARVWSGDCSRETVDNSYGLWIAAPVFGTSDHVGTNDYGIYVGDASAGPATNIYGAYIENRAVIEAQDAEDKTVLSLIQNGTDTGGHLNLNDIAADPTVSEGDLHRNGNNIRFEGSSGSQAVFWATLAANQTIDLTGAAPRTLTIENSTASQQCNVAIDGTYSWRAGHATGIFLFAGTPTSTRLITWPDATGTVCLIGEAQTLTNKTISGVTITDATNIVFGDTTGSIIGSSNSEKLSLWGAEPIVQPSASGEVTGHSAGAGTAVAQDSTFTGNTGSTAYTINDMIKHFKNIGALAP